MECGLPGSRKILVPQVQVLLLSTGQKEDIKARRILPLLSMSVQLCLNTSAAGVVVFWSEPLGEMVSVSSDVPGKFAGLQAGQKSAMPGLAPPSRGSTGC